MSNFPHFDPTVLYFIAAATYVLAALMAMRGWHKPMYAFYGLLAVLYCLFGLSHLAQ